MRLNIEVPDETWAVALTVIAEHRGGNKTSCAMNLIINPKNEVSITWDDNEPCVLKSEVYKND